MAVDARRKVRPSAHVYRWRLESLVPFGSILFAIVLAAVLLVAVSALLSGPSAPSGAASNDQDLLVRVTLVALLASIAVVSYLLATRTPVRQGPG